MAWRMLSSIRSRIVVLILASAVPLLILAITVSWQGYDFAVSESREQMRVTRAAAVARHQAAVSGGLQLLAALGEAPTVREALSHGGSEACTTLLGRVRMIDAARYAVIGAVDPAGRPLCRSDGESGGGFDGTLRDPWFAAFVADIKDGHAREGAVGPLRAAPGGPLLPVAFPVRGEGTLLALVRVDWLSDPVGAGGLQPSTWVVAADGQVLDTGQNHAADLPRLAVLQPLLQGDAVVAAQSMGGRRFAYAAADLGNGLRLLVGEPVSANEAAARRTLSMRIGAILVLMLLGLAAVVSGAHAAVVAPVKRLDGAVRRWRNGASFDPGVSLSLPAELRELATSFAEASGVLTEREAQLRGALRQQELLMQEIHHRVKNNLQIIASLLNLQASRIRQPQARTEFESARDRVRAIATLHRYLYSHGEVHTINMRSFLAELCGQLFEAMGELPGERIRLDIEAPELRTLSDQAVPLALIVTEVVSNALKFAFPQARPGRIGIRLTAGETSAELLIEDDGVGIAHAAAEPAGRPAGIGLQLINGFVRQLRATLEIDESQGTRYLLRLPLHRERLVDPAGAAG